MAVLPVSTLNLNTGTIVESEPSLTWFIDQKSKRIRGTCDGYEAVKQAVDIILHTERYLWQIYRPSSGVEDDGLIGLDSGYVALELRRRITDALMMDNRVTGLSEFHTAVSGDSLSLSFVVNTVYGDIPEEVNA